jgi:hypothetical protein
MTLQNIHRVYLHEQLFPHPLELELYKCQSMDIQMLEMILSISTCPNDEMNRMWVCVGKGERVLLSTNAVVLVNTHDFSQRTQ